MAAQHSHEDSDNEDSAHDLFADPPDYYPPSPTPTTETHTLISGRTITVSLVGHNPLWGHHLWNAGRIVSTFLEKNPSLIKEKTVLELGAGAGLPSLVCRTLGASRVVVSDYPDPDLVQNLWKNAERLEGELIDGDVKEENGKDTTKRLVAEGYCWGADPQILLQHLSHSILSPLPSSKTAVDDQISGFDILILADLLFNHSEHEKLVSTIESTLRKDVDAKALVFFTPYRPWLFDKDMAFFDFVRKKGFVVEKILEEKMEKVMFEADPGDEVLRRTVFGFVVRWNLQ